MQLREVRSVGMGQKGGRWRKMGSDERGLAHAVGQVLPRAPQAGDGGRSCAFSDSSTLILGRVEQTPERGGTLLVDLWRRKKAGQFKVIV